MTMKLYLPFAFILGMIATLGCGSDAPKGPEKLSTTPVDGIVTLKGLPAADAMGLPPWCFQNYGWPNQAV